MPVAPPGPQFSVREIPFSYCGSWFNFSHVIAEKTYADDIHLVSHQSRLHPVLRIVPESAGVRATCDIGATPALMTWSAGDGRIDVAYETADTVRIRGHRLGVRVTAAATTLTPFSGPYFINDPVDGSYLFTIYETGRRYRITMLTGQPTVLGAHRLGVAERGIVLAEDEPWELVIEEFDNARPAYRSIREFDRVTAAAAEDFMRYADAVAPWRGVDTPAAELAAYVLWSATVAPGGFFARPAVLMSKHWMDKVWSWDHCFNALALAPGLPATAWDQFRLPFDHQTTSGALPDSVAHSEVLYNFVKPPIHGWTLRQLRASIASLSEDELLTAYRAVARWTNFWLAARRAPGHELAHYQHGNDSGWDNATTFDGDPVVESADLAAFLVLQLRELAVLAAFLRLPDEAAAWTHAADGMRRAVLDLWTGERFAARSVRTGHAGQTSSLLDLMPVVLGDELPADVLASLAERVERHLTPFGLATELPTSPHYQADGYWRGPIWAPATVLIEDGLRRGGFIDLADEISRRFRATCEASGFAENFDALTGRGLRDRAYTWTASAYLLLSTAHEARRAS